MKNLTKSDLVEICYALQINDLDFQRGTYGPTVDGDVNIPKWIKQLQRIQKKLGVA